MKYLTTLILAFVVAATFAQTKGVKISPKSPWIESIDYNLNAMPENGQGAGFYYLLQDEQENTATEESYEHYAYKILTSEGVQDMSDLSFDFEPSYQQLILHEIRIIRNGQAINQMPKSLQVIQREQSLEYKLYNGTKTTIVNLKDVRVGDVVEYSFTLKGYNPVFKGHISRTYYFDTYYSVDISLKRILLPSSTNIRLKNFGKSTPELVVTESKGTKDYRWTRTKIKATEFEYSVPSWYDNNNMVMLSDFQSWQDVGNWARELFNVSADERRKIASMASTFRSADDEQYILDVIRFVQDDVRYLGIETGVSSHKPYPPSQIFGQRFGDCKDKSLLLATLLQSRNIEAYPVLINTSLKQSLDDYLPSGMIFDHCIAGIIFNGKKFFIDPTMSNQGGDLSTYVCPDYRRGLIMDDDIQSPDTLPSPATPTTSEMHNIEAHTPGGEATLSIRITFTGSDADYQRIYFSQTPLENIQKNYLDFYANLYPDIQRWEDMKFTDDRKANAFIVEDKYRIPTFWKPRPDAPNELHATIQPLSITSYFDVAKNIQQRTLPFSLNYPVDHFHTIQITLPFEFAVSPAKNAIETPYYQYKTEIVKDGNQISKVTHYQTKQDYIPADHIQTYVKDHTAMYNELVFQLTYNTSVVDASKNIWPGLITTIFSLIGGALVCFYIYKKYDPAPARYMVRGQPIQGWLVLLAFGLVLSPFRLIYDLIQNSTVLTGEGWMSFLAAKNYGLGIFLFFSHIFNVFKLLFLTMLIALFFQRRTSFPRLMTIFMAVNLLVLSIDTIWSRTLADDPETIPLKDTISSIIGAVLWIPYLNISQRVKETFVIRGPEYNDNENNDECTPVQDAYVENSEVDLTS